MINDVLSRILRDQSMSTNTVFQFFSQFSRSSATALNKVLSMQIHMLYKINYYFLTKTVCVISWILWACILHLDLLHNPSSYSCHVYIHIYIYIYIYIYFINTILFSRSSPSWVFLLDVSGEFEEWFQCQSVISIELLCSFVVVTLRCWCSVNLLCIFRAPHCGRT